VSSSESSSIEILAGDAMDLIPALTQTRRTVVLAPSLSQVPSTFEYADVDPGKYNRLLMDVQRLRGSVYLKDGAISVGQLTSDGRHEQTADDQAWHVLTLNTQGKVVGCSRYLAHRRDVTYSQLELAKSASIARSEQYGAPLRRAVEAEIALARQLRFSYVELGGWALSEELRCSTEALRIALSTYSLANLLGGCIGISTVTVRNCSSSILRRIGGSSLWNAGEALPRYFDPSYNCDMEILRFDSRSPNPRFRDRVESIKMDMLDIPVICATPGWPVRIAAMESAPSLDRHRHAVLLPRTA
jgi:hypothetical protein